MLKIGSDLDGVLARNHLNKAEYRPYKLHEYYSKCKPTTLSKMSIDVIITGRKLHFRKVTQEWLSSNGIKYKDLIMFPDKTKKNNRTLAEYKAVSINRLGLKVYFEDDKRIAEYLRGNCLNTEIIFVC